MSAIITVYLIVILTIYIGVAAGRIPGLRMNRTTITIVGAAVLIAIGAINEKQAFAAIDLGTIVLLFSMMVINAHLRLAGFFQVVGYRTLLLARSPQMLLALIIGASGLFSALFLNDPVCLLFTPLVIDLTVSAKRDPIPYLLGLATAANVGSTATITGNPQNLIIGQASGISYLTFLLHLGPIALIGLFVCWIVIIRLYPAEFSGLLPPIALAAPRPYRPLFWRATLVVIGLLIAYLIGLPTASAALVAAGVLLISRLRPKRIFDLIQWDLLVFFAALFIVTGAIETTGLSDRLFSLLAPILHSGLFGLSAITALLSNIVSNVPAVLLLRPVIASFANPQQGWLALAMASTLAGNMTVLGSVANLIVVEIAGQRQVMISFRTYLRAGVAITIMTLVVGILWLSIFP